MRRWARALSIAAAVAAGCAGPLMGPLTSGAGGSGGAGGAGGAVGPGGLGGAGGVAVDAGPDVDATACAAFVETFMPACDTCLDVACCEVAAACFAVPDCFSYTSCEQNCPPAPDGASNTCLAECAMLYPDGGSAFAALVACLQTSCASSCPY
jgi:hypothetical protein